MSAIRTAVLTSLAAASILALAAPASAQLTYRPQPNTGRQPSPPSTSKYTVRCTKLRDRAQVHNVGANTIPQGARIDIYMYEPGSSQYANGTGVTDKDISPGQSWIHPIKYSMTADHCTAVVTHDPGDKPL